MLFTSTESDCLAPSKFTDRAWSINIFQHLTWRLHFRVSSETMNKKISFPTSSRRTDTAATATQRKFTRNMPLQLHQHRAPRWLWNATSLHSTMASQEQEALNLERFLDPDLDSLEPEWLPLFIWMRNVLLSFAVSFIVIGRGWSHVYVGCWYSSKFCWYWFFMSPLIELCIRDPDVRPPGWIRRRRQ